MKADHVNEAPLVLQVSVTARLSAPVGSAPWTGEQLDNCKVAVQEVIMNSRAQSLQACAENVCGSHVGLTAAQRITSSWEHIGS